MSATDKAYKTARRLRRNLSLPEKLLWVRIKGSDLHFRKQHPLGDYILDFYCATAKLCVEIDGPMHEERAERDQRRTAWLAKEGITVIRFSVEEIDARPAAVLATVARGAPPSTA